jgi:quercetin dioxygenase-like cupin family protein
MATRNLSTAVATDAAAGAAVTIAPGIVVRRRSSGGEPQYAIIHPLSTETYYIVEGTGSLVTGGTLDPPPVEPADPDVVRSKAIKNGVTHKVAKGDVVVVPPGTPHWFNAIDGTITYLEPRAWGNQGGRQRLLSHSAMKGVGMIMPAVHRPVVLRLRCCRLDARACLARADLPVEGS